MKTERAVQSGKGRPVVGPKAANGQEANRVLPHDRAAHEWYRFVLSFPPHLVRSCLQRFDVGPNHQVLDPFCGTGTTLVAAAAAGRNAIGVEIDPAYARLARERLATIGDLFNRR